MTLAEERRVRDAAKAKASKRFCYAPVGMDIWDPKTPLTPGDIVVRIQPTGCPKNGTMGHTFVGDPETGAFLGLVLTASLRSAR